MSDQPGELIDEALGLVVIELGEKPPLLVAAVVLSHGHLVWLAIPLFFFVGRPLLWRFAGRRVGWRGMGCGVGQNTHSGTYI